MEEVNTQGLQPATKYIFRVVAYNQNGPGKPSAELAVITDPDGTIIHLIFHFLSLTF